MTDLGEIVRTGLETAKTKADITELCRRALAHVEEKSFGKHLFIRYMQPVYSAPLGKFDNINGLMPSGRGRTTVKITAGLAFFLQSDIENATGTPSIHVGGAVRHPTDPWNKNLGKTVAALRAIRVPGKIAAHMLFRTAPWEGDARRNMSFAGMRTLLSPGGRPLQYPWSTLVNTQLPTLAIPAAVDAIRYAYRYMLSGESHFSVLAMAGDTHPGCNPPVDENVRLAIQLIDAACTLPVHTPLSATERAQLEQEGRAVAAMATTDNEVNDEAPSEGSDAGSCADPAEVSA